MSASPESLRRAPAETVSTEYRLHPGRCVVVTPPDASQVIGRGRLQQRLRLRRGSIRAHAAPALLEGWRWAGEAAAAAGDRSHRGAVTVHVLRATRDGVCSREEAAQWRAWARAQRAAGAVLLVVVQDPPERGLCGRRPAGSVRRAVTASRGYRIAR